MSTLFSGHYLRNRSTLDIGVLDYIDIVLHKEHSPEVLSIPSGTPCISNKVIYVDLKVPTIRKEITKFSVKYRDKIKTHKRTGIHTT